MTNFNAITCDQMIANAECYCNKKQISDYQQTVKDILLNKDVTWSPGLRTVIIFALSCSFEGSLRKFLPKGPLPKKFTKLCLKLVPGETNLEDILNGK